MPVINCLPNVWTTIPDLGADQIIEAREKGLYVDTTGSLPAADAATAFSLPGLNSMVVQAERFATSVRVMPANPVVAASVRHQPV
jgi:hypothetical protein